MRVVQGKTRVLSERQNVVSAPGRAERSRMGQILSRTSEVIDSFGFAKAFLMLIRKNDLSKIVIRQCKTFVQFEDNVVIDVRGQ